MQVENDKYKAVILDNIQATKYKIFTDDYRMKMN